MSDVDSVLLDMLLGVMAYFAVGCLATILLLRMFLSEPETMIESIEEDLKKSPEKRKYLREKYGEGYKIEMVLDNMMNQIHWGDTLMMVLQWPYYAYIMLGNALGFWKIKIRLKLD